MDSKTIARNRLSDMIQSENLNIQLSEYTLLKEELETIILRHLNLSPDQYDIMIRKKSDKKRE